MTRAVAVALALVALAGCGATSSEGGDPVTVTYFVEGTARSADITISEPGGGSSQQSGVDVPLTVGGRRGLTVTYQPGDFLYLSAQSIDERYRSVRCRIEVDGVEVDRATSRGEYVIATCEGRA